MYSAEYLGKRMILSHICCSARFVLQYSFLLKSRSRSRSITLYISTTLSPSQKSIVHRSWDGERRIPEKNSIAMPLKD